MKKLSNAPLVPTVHYIFCPTCNVMKDLLIADDFHVVDQDNIAHQCKGCSSVYFMEPNEVPTSEREAYERTIAYMGSVAQHHANEANSLGRTVEMLKTINHQNQAHMIKVSSNVFVIEKSARDIQNFITLKNYDEAKEEALDLEIFITNHKKKMEPENGKI